MIQLSNLSKDRLQHTFDMWHVDKEFSNVMENYLLHGYPPGGFFVAVLANDALAAFSKSHPSNTMPALKKLAGWIRDYVPAEAKGSYDAVAAWEQISDEKRRQLLESKQLIYSEKDETFMILSAKNG